MRSRALLPTLLIFPRTFKMGKYEVTQAQLQQLWVRIRRALNIGATIGINLLNVFPGKIA